LIKKRKIGEPNAGIVEQMFDSIVAPDIHSSDGLGTDNMTCIVIEFKN